MKKYNPEGWWEESNAPRRPFFTPAVLSTALATQDVLEGTVLMCDQAHNLTVDLGCMRGVIPRNEGAIGIEEGSTREIALISRVGKPVCFVVTDFSTDELGNPIALLSRKQAQLAARQDFLAHITLGDIINAKVTHLENFGAFCDIGCGNIALLPIDAISVSRISHPRDRFRIGDQIKAVVRGIAPDGKITLSHKELLGTWEENAENFHAGQTVTGVIRSIEDYGAFVELAPNLAGLAEPHNGIRIGERASVFIKSVLPEKMKIKLIIIDSFSDRYLPDFHYFFTGDHIDEWHYSPTCCEKRIVSCF